MNLDYEFPFYNDFSKDFFDDEIIGFLVRFLSLFIRMDFSIICIYFLGV